MDRKSVNSGIRGVLNSSPNPLTINELWSDYIKLTGSPVPLRDLGFRSLHDYLRSIPDVVSLDEPNSPHSLVRAVTDAKSKHIAQFVRDQKVSKNSRPPPRRRPFYRAPLPNDFVPLNLQQRVLDTLTRYTDGLHIDDFRSIVADIQGELQLQCQFDSVLRKIQPFVTHDDNEICLTRQYLNRYSAPSSQNLPRRPNEVIVISESDTEDDYDDDLQSHPSDSEEYACSSSRSDDLPPTQATKRSLPNGDEARRRGTLSSARSLVSDTLVKNLFALLDDNPSGFWLTDLEVKYENKFGYRLDPLQHGFDCVLDMVIQLKDVFHMVKYEKSGDRFLRDARKIERDSNSADQGELPKSVVLDIKRLLLRRSNHQLYTDELAAEYRECYRKTFNPSDFGFNNMDGLLKSLNDNESSIFSFKQVRQRTVMYLKVIHSDEQNYNEANDSEGALPCNYDFNFLPREVCNYDFKLPFNPILNRLMPGQRITVKLAEVYGPEKFFLHFAEDVDNLNSMMDDLHIFYENNSNTYELSYDTVRRGMLCACPFHQDSKWHRVQVMMCKSISDVKVRYFDFGTIRDISVGKLRYLHSDFARLPALCVRTKLSGIKIKTFDETEKEEQKDYSRLVGESFFDLANGAKELEAEIVSVDVMKQCLEVHLFAKYEGGKVISIHEKLISDGLVYKEKIDDVAEIPLPPTPKQKPASKVTSSSLPSTSTTATAATSSGQAKSKKSRPPPGIPIPPSLNMSNSSTSSSTKSTANQNKPTCNGYTQSKMNPLNPPFYPNLPTTAENSGNRTEQTICKVVSQILEQKNSKSNYTTAKISAGYNPPPAATPPVYQTSPQAYPTPSIYPLPAHSMPMTQPIPSYIFPTPRPAPMYPTPSTYPPAPMYGTMYGPYAGPPAVYDYYGSSAAIRGPMPSTYPGYNPPREAPKPPPGINYNPVKATSGIPSVAKATGIPLYKCDASSTSLNRGSCFDQTALNTYCCCGLDCSLNVLPSAQPDTPSALQNKPEWISKLEVVRDLVLKKDLSPQSVSGKLKEIIGDINADDATTEVVENPAKVSKKRPVSAAIVEDTLTNNLNGLSISNDRSSTPIPPVENGTVDLSNVSPVTPTKSECEYSVKSEGKESTRDEVKTAKIEQLRLFVMLQSKNIKKT